MTASAGEGPEADDHQRPAARAPVLAGHRVVLRPVLPRDYEALYQVELSADLGWRWRHGGSTPSFEDFVRGLWAGVLAQFIVADTATGRPVGIAALYRPNFRDGWAYFGAASFDPSDRSGRGIDALVLLVDYGFTSFDFRKLYAEVGAFNYVSFRSGAGRFFEEEACLREHVWRAGRYWDEYVLAVHRGTWERWRPVIVPRVVEGRRHRQGEAEPTPTVEWATSYGSEAQR